MDILCRQLLQQEKAYKIKRLYTKPIDPETSTKEDPIIYSFTYCNINYLIIENYLIIGLIIRSVDYLIQCLLLIITANDNDEIDKEPARILIDNRLDKVKD